MKPAIDWNRVTNFSDLVDQSAATFGSKVALKDLRRELTFTGFAEEIDRISAALTSRGILQGARIAILSQNRVEVPVLLGLCRAGFVPVPLNWRLPTEDLVSLLKDCDPAVMFVEDRYAAQIAQLAAVDSRMLIVVVGDANEAALTYASLVESDAVASPVDINPDSPACIIYTSGTTSAPKGAVLTHGAIALNCRDCARDAIGFQSEDVSLMVMPLFHVGGVWYYMFPSIFSGCKTVLRERFDPQLVIEAFQSEQVTNIHVVPTMLADLLGRPAFVETASALRLVIYAGSSMPVDLLTRAMGTLAQCEFAQAYGSTEAGSITALPPAAHRLAIQDSAHRRLLRSCGKALPETKIRIDVPLESSGDDGIGEILVQSGKLMASYWRRPEETADRKGSGWFRTGDLGYFDEEGYLYIVDRKNDMIISGGENIFPFEVEEVLCGHPLIKEASVFGLPDARWVEKVVAAIVLMPDASMTESEVIEFARTHLPGYKTPKTVHVVTDLPKNPVGKVLRKSLRQQFDES